ncbi:MAG: sigma-70 family RNA polymerase sigma factor [Actinobacteria bacterium]|nr:sigma-70 family RNA polymerase sigma factor [Actinomycetota bacterium]
MKGSERAKAGAEVDQIEEIYRCRGRAFERVAIAIAADEGLGLDAVSEAFARAIKSRKAFRGEGSLEAWLWRILINEAKRRATRREVAIENIEAGAADHEPLERTERSFVRSRIAALPEQQRNALFLRYYADLDYAAIASTLGIAAGSVAASLHAAHGRLATELEEVRPWKRSIK